MLSFQDREITHRRKIPKAMKIYRVTTDLDCWSLLPTDKEFWKQTNLFQVHGMRATWRNPAFYVRDPVRTHCMDFNDVAAGAFVYGEKVNQSDFGEIIEKSGEVLPAIMDASGESVYVFNATACYNCLDRKNTDARWTPDNSVAIQVQEYAFHADRIGDRNLFKIPEMKRVGLFALVGRDEPEDEFYTQYHALGFTGLKFEEVWSDEVN
jgi:hypothetical protein